MLNIVVVRINMRIAHSVLLCIIVSRLDLVELNVAQYLCFKYCELESITYSENFREITFSDFYFDFELSVYVDFIRWYISQVRELSVRNYNIKSSSQNIVICLIVSHIILLCPKKLGTKQPYSRHILIVLILTIGVLQRDERRNNTLFRFSL